MNAHVAVAPRKSTDPFLRFTEGAAAYRRHREAHLRKGGRKSPPVPFEVVEAGSLAGKTRNQIAETLGVTYEAVTAAIARHNLEVPDERSTKPGTPHPAPKVHAAAVESVDAPFDPLLFIGRGALPTETAPAEEPDVKDKYRKSPTFGLAPKERARILHEEVTEAITRIVVEEDKTPTLADLERALGRKGPHIKNHYHSVLAELKLDRADGRGKNQKAKSAEVRAEILDYVRKHAEKGAPKPSARQVSLALKRQYRAVLRHYYDAVAEAYPKTAPVVVDGVEVKALSMSEIKRTMEHLETLAGQSMAPFLEAINGKPPVTLNDVVEAFAPKVAVKASSLATDANVEKLARKLAAKAKQDPEAWVDGGFLRPDGTFVYDGLEQNGAFANPWVYAWRGFEDDARELLSALEA